MIDYHDSEFIKLELQGNLDLRVIIETWDYKHVKILFTEVISTHTRLLGGISELLVCAAAHSVRQAALAAHSAEGTLARIFQKLGAKIILQDLEVAAVRVTSKREIFKSFFRFFR